jgi:hypothetical protein
MRTGSQHITTVIRGNANIMARLTNGLYWEIAPEGTTTPLATFSITQVPGPSKDFSGQYTVNVFVFEETLTNAATTAAIIVQEIKNSDSNNWRLTNQNSGYTSDVAREAFIQLTFTFKI